MSANTLKDTHGRPLPTISSTSVKSGVSTLLETVARRGVVALTKNRKTKAVVLSVGEYEALIHREPDPLGAYESYFDRQFDAMQGAVADAAFERAMTAGPDELGQAAIDAASKGD